MRPNGWVTIATWAVLSGVVFLSVAADEARSKLVREAAARGVEAKPANVRVVWGAFVFDDVELRGRIDGNVRELRAPFGNERRLDARGGHIEAHGELTEIIGRPIDLHDVHVK